MGYYTKFELHAVNAENLFPIDGELEREIALRIWEITDGYSYKGWKPQTFDDAVNDDAMKWYDHEEDMTNLSKEYPNVVFILDGVGEEFPDAWRKWFHNGKCEASYAEIVYPKPSNPLFASLNY